MISPLSSKLPAKSSPAQALPKDRKGKDLPLTFQSGGLILYQDKNNFLRLERAGSVIIDQTCSQFTGS